MKITRALRTGAALMAFSPPGLAAPVPAAPGRGTDAPPVTGTVATNRMGAAQSAFLRSAGHVRGSAAGPEVELPPDIAAGLAGVLLSDRTWVGRPGIYDAKTGMGPFHPTIRFTISQGTGPGSLPRIDVGIDPVSQQMSTEAWGFNAAHGWEQSTSYALSAAQMNTLLKRAFPQDAQTQALTAAPRPAADGGVPADARARIATLHTGMTRADLLKMFGTEGGLSSRFQRSYVYRPGAEGSAVSVPGRGVVQINAEFMPRGAHLEWVEGAGILIDPEELYRFGALSERPDDVIVRLSTPYVGMVASD